MNIRLHLAMHDVVAKQLADDDPPEVYQTARRLLDAGYDRHEVLHILARPMASQIHATLTDRQPYTTPGTSPRSARSPPPGSRSARNESSRAPTDTGPVQANGADEALAHRLTSCRAQSDGCTRAG
jgi:hypothetical protein